MRKMAIDSYKTATCSALMGVYLFADGARIDRAHEAGPPLQLCLGDREWVQCPGGLPDVFTHLKNEDCGGRVADLPEDWGVVATAPAGEVLYRALTFDALFEVSYLGHAEGELATGRVTIETIGIGPMGTDVQRPRGSRA